MIGNPIVIFGSSRSDGDTILAVETVLDERNIPIVDLHDLNISEYDYAASNADDDFRPLVVRMLAHDPIVLASPIYWYAMSARMKQFIDRWTDLLDRWPQLGRGLRGKTLAVITGYAEHPDGRQGFEAPFALTASYMGMKYGGCFYYYSGVDEKLRNVNDVNALEFASRLFK
jgi:multimeric flavodoxin WrbA